MNKRIIVFVLILLLVGGFAFSRYSLSKDFNKRTKDESTQEVVNRELEYMNKLFNKDKVLDIDISMEKEQWDEMLKNASEEQKYAKADITINGEKFADVGIKTKGSASLQMIAASDKSNRFSFKIKTDEFVEDQKIYGLSKFVLNCNIGDATNMKEYISYDMLTSMGVPSPGFAFTNVKVNGEAWGTYLAVESLEKPFVERNFNTKNGHLYKIEDVEGIDQLGNSLCYVDDNISSYPTIFRNAVFKKTTEEDNKRVITAIKNLNAGSDLEKYINVDEVLRYFAVNTYIVNLDSYACINKHNYLLYEEGGKVTIIPWDYNIAFGGFAITSAEELINFPIDKPLILDTMDNSPLLAKLIEVPEYKEKYHNYLKEIIDKYSGDGKFQKKIDHIDSLIGESIKDDPTAFYTYDQYKKGIYNLKIYGEDRDKSILAQLDGSESATEYGNIPTKLNLDLLGEQTDLVLGTPGNRGELDKINVRGVEYVGLGQLLGAFDEAKAAEELQRLNITQEEATRVLKAMGVQ